MEFILDWGEITYINKVPHGGQLRPQRAPLRPLDGHMRPKGVDMGSLGGNLGRQGGDIGPLKMTWGLRRWEGVSGRSLGALGRSLGTSGRSYRPSGKSLLSCKDVHWLPGKSIGGLRKVTWWKWLKTQERNHFKSFKFHSFTFFAIFQLLVGRFQNSFYLTASTSNFQNSQENRIFLWLFIWTQ